MSKEMSGLCPRPANTVPKALYGENQGPGTVIAPARTGTGFAGGKRHARHLSELAHLLL